MKKIMFNDKYGLTQAVLEGRKTMTRRIVQDDVIKRYDDPWDLIGNCARYHFDEVVAIAQSYNDVNSGGYPVDSRYDPFRTAYSVGSIKESNGGWNNKMFVRADLMPCHIKITDIKVEKLQNISEEDCLREGIQEYFPYIDYNPNDRCRTFQYYRDGKIRHRISPAPKCFALLIDDICGKGTWEKNPWVFVYSFELID